MKKKCISYICIVYKDRLVKSNKTDVVLESIILPIKLCLQVSPLLQYTLKLILFYEAIYCLSKYLVRIMNNLFWCLRHIAARLLVMTTVAGQLVEHRIT